jgi:hypothetical protein
MNALNINLKKRAPTYSYSHVAKMYTFLVDSEASEEQLCAGVNFLVEEHPDNININLDGEMKELPCLYEAKLFR